MPGRLALVLAVCAAGPWVVNGQLCILCVRCPLLSQQELPILQLCLCTDPCVHQSKWLCDAAVTKLSGITSQSPLRLLAAKLCRFVQQHPAGHEAYVLKSCLLVVCVDCSLDNHLHLHAMVLLDGGTGDTAHVLARLQAQGVVERLAGMLS